MKNIIGIALLVLLLINKATAQDLIGHVGKQGQITLNYQPPAGNTGFVFSATFNWFYYDGSNPNTSHSFLQFVLKSVKIEDYVFVDGKRYSKEDVSLVTNQYPKAYSWESHLSRGDFGIKTSFGETMFHGKFNNSYPFVYKSDFDGFTFTLDRTTTNKPIPFSSLGNPELIVHGNSSHEMKNVLRLKEEHSANSKLSKANIKSSNTINKSNTTGNSTTQEINTTTCTNLSKSKSVEYTNKGNQFYANGSYGDAEMYWRKALELDPYNQIVKNNLTNLKSIQNRNAQIMAQSQQRTNNFNAQQQNIQQSSENIANNLVDGSPNAVGQAGVATAKLLAESGASITETIAGGAGVAVVGALLNGGNNKIENDKIVFKNGIYYGKSIRGMAHGEGVKKYNNGIVFKGKVYQNRPYNGIMTYTDQGEFKGQYHASGNFTWKYGKYITPNRKLIFNGSFSRDQEFESGTISLFTNRNYKIVWDTYMDKDFKYPTLTFSNKHALHFLKPKNKKKTLRLYYVIRKNNGSVGKEVKISISDIDETIQLINEMDGKNNIADIFAFWSNYTKDNEEKEKYYQLALKNALNQDKYNQIVELHQHPLVISSIVEKWKRYAILCRSDSSPEKRLKDPTFNYYSAKEAWAANKPLESEKFINIAIENSNTKYYKTSLCTYYGAFLNYSQEYEKAQEFLLKGIELNPGHYLCQAEIAWSYYCLGEYEKCIEHSKLALQDKKNSKKLFYARYNIALATLSLNKFQEAKSLYKRYRKINRKNGLEAAIQELKQLSNNGKFVEEANYIISNILN